MAGRKVRIAFVDVATGREFARTELEADVLPEGVEIGHTVYVDDTPWSVRDTDGSVAKGRLTLTVDRVRTVAPSDILYTLPTISDVVPHLVPSLGDAVDDAVGESAGDGVPYRMHEDDWRQTEFVSAELGALIDEELRGIQRIYADHANRDDQGRLLGFDAIHVRTQPLHPLVAPVSLAALTAILAAGQRSPGVCFDSADGVAADSFATTIGPLTVYGVADGDEVIALALHSRPVAGPPLADLTDVVRRILRECRVVLVDWPRCATIAPDAVFDYLAATTSA